MQPPCSHFCFVELDDGLVLTTASTSCPIKMTDMLAEVAYMPVVLTQFSHVSRLFWFTATPCESPCTCFSCNMDALMQDLGRCWGQVQGSLSLGSQVQGSLSLGSQLCLATPMVCMLGGVLARSQTFCLTQACVVSQNLPRRDRQPMPKQSSKRWITQNQTLCLTPRPCFCAE